MFRKTIRLFRTMTAVAIANYCVSTEVLCMATTTWSLLAGTLTITRFSASRYSYYTAKTKYRNFKTNIPRKGISGLCPNFYIHASVSDLYIPTIGLPILLEEICRPILGLYKSLTGTCMLKLGLRPRYSQKRNT